MSASNELLWSTPAPGCVVLTLNRPDRGNALSASLVQALDEAMDRAEQHPPRLLVFRGVGRNFCTGFDLSDLHTETDDSLLARFTRVELLLQRVYYAPFATLALAQGRTMGAGADLFCACTERWMVGDTSFAFPGAGFGLVLGTRRLAHTVGPRQALAWIESGATIDAANAIRSALASAHVQTDALDDAIESLLHQKSRLDDTTQPAIHQAAHARLRSSVESFGAEDLSRLVRSAARPGLKQRIQDYRAAQIKS